MIAAKAHSDDRNIEVIFDALEFFEQASDEEIIALADCGWGGDYPADEVALFMASKIPDLAKMFIYLEIIADDPMKKDCNGFECHIDEPQAMAWLNKNRSHLAQVIEQAKAAES